MLFTKYAALNLQCFGIYLLGLIVTALP